MALEEVPSKRGILDRSSPCQHVGIALQLLAARRERNSGQAGSRDLKSYSHQHYIFCALCRGRTVQSQLFSVVSFGSWLVGGELFHTAKSEVALKRPRDELFQGKLLCHKPAYSELFLEARAVVEKCFGSEPESLSPERFQEALRLARGTVSETRFQDLAWAAVGWNAEGVLMDAVRLRAVSPGLERVPAAAAVFYCHRDTWYGNPKCQVNGWLPLHDVNGENSFRFFLDYFHKPIENDSERFVAADFAGEGGFGRVAGGEMSTYPRALVEPQGAQRDIEQSGGDLLLFSAAHLHQTQVNRTNKVRFSLDFRFFYQEDLENGVGAPDPDNRSQGLGLESYRAL